MVSSDGYNTSYTYGLNSQPLTIERHGLMSDGETVGLVDDLALTYSGNQLIKVEDSADPVILESSLDAQSGTFSYDCDGRIERFGAAGMTKYAPNDMPVYIRSQGHYGLAEFAYTATGEKLMSAICDSRTGSPRERRLYVGQFELFKSREDTVPKLNRINLPWGYVTSDGQTYLYTTDYQGNIRVVTDSEGNAVQTTDYYPYGLPMATSTGAAENRYKFGGKEFETAQGLNFHDFEARMLFNDRLLFNRLDDKADSYPFQNPYLYCAANPIIYTDPTGMAVIITGTNQDSAVEELQKAVGDCMKLSINDAGKLCYKIEDGKTLSDNATSMKEYIDNESITVHYNNVDGFKTSEGQNMFGGAYMGNKISDDKKTVDAYQEVNTTVLSKMSDAHGKPGADAFHELSEAVEGAKIALKSGKSSPKAGDNSSTYEEAHAKAYPQSGPVYFKGYDEKGNEIINPLSPENITKVRSAEWFINNIKGDKVILRKL